MEVLAALCFNGELSVNSTEAVIFRDVHNNSLTMFLDEVDNLKKEDRERYGAIMDVLKTGFSKSGMVKRCGGKDKDEIRKFCTYSPKMMAGMSEIDVALRSRTIRLGTLRKLHTEQTERYAEKRTIVQFQNRVRDELYMFGLQYGVQLGEAYVEELEAITGLEHLDNREFDVWAPMIVIANLVDTSRGDGQRRVTDAMMRFSTRRIEERFEEDSGENETVRLLRVLNEMITDLHPVKMDGSLMCFDKDEAFEYFGRQEDFDSQDELKRLRSKTSLTQKLRKVEVRTKTYNVRGKSKSLYVVDPEKLEEYTLRFGPI